MSDQISFIDYWDAVDRHLIERLGIDTGDAGVEADQIAAAQEAGETPEQFARKCGE